MNCIDHKDQINEQTNLQINGLTQKFSVCLSWLHFVCVCLTPSIDAIKEQFGLGFVVTVIASVTKAMFGERKIMLGVQFSAFIYIISYL